MNLKKDIIIDSVPNHIAIIMDGNGRWAKKGIRAGIMVIKKEKNP